MNSQIIIKHEYFELVKKLNRANKFKNQNTELYFFVDSTNLKSFKLYAAISATQKIFLCHKNTSFKWKAAGFSEFQNLEEFIARLLQSYRPQVDLTAYLKSHIFKLAN